MDNLHIEKTDQSPAVDFNFTDQVFKLSGESFMEDVSNFYAELTDSLEAHFSEQKDAHIKFIFELDYFNSSSSRVIFKLFELFDQTGAKGNNVKVDWYFDDEDIAEEAEELAEGFQNFAFKLIEKVG